MIEAQPVNRHEWRAGSRRPARLAYVGVLGVFCCGTFVQIYFAGVGAFGHGAFGLHETTGNVLGIVAVVAFVASLVARAGRAAILGSFLLALMTEVAQHGLASGGHDSKWVGGLHALDGFAIVGLGLWLFVSARRRVT